MGNAKLDSGIAILSLPAGHACPGANQCKSKTVVDKSNPCGYGIQDGPNCLFRCFAATDESKYPNVRLARWHNFDTLKKCKSLIEMISLISKSLPESKFNLPVRLHASGDFFSQMYFDAWLEIAKMNPNRIFYGYTKSLTFLVKRLNDIPNNFRLTASYGGLWDSLIEKHSLKYAKVVFTPNEADKLGLKIDHDDSLCYGDNSSFALLLHGTQPAGSPAAKAWSTLKKNKMGGYGTQKAGRATVSKNGGGATPSPAAKMVSVIA